MHTFSPAGVFAGTLFVCVIHTGAASDVRVSSSLRVGPCAEKGSGRVTGVHSSGTGSPGVTARSVTTAAMSPTPFLAHRDETLPSHSARAGVAPVTIVRLPRAPVHVSARVTSDDGRATQQGGRDKTHTVVGPNSRARRFAAPALLTGCVPPALARPTNTQLQRVQWDHTLGGCGGATAPPSNRFARAHQHACAHGRGFSAVPRADSFPSRPFCASSPHLCDAAFCLTGSSCLPRFQDVSRPGVLP